MITQQLFPEIRTQAGKRVRLQTPSEFIFRTNLNGCFSCDITIRRKSSTPFLDVGLGNPLSVYTNAGRRVWYGRVNDIDITNKDGDMTVKITALGWWNAFYDDMIKDTFKSYTTPEAVIGAVLAHGNTPFISTSTALVATTGITAYKYATDDNAASWEYPGDIINKVCGVGDTSKNSIYPAVWTDVDATTQKPILDTYAVNHTTPTATYKMRLDALGEYNLKRSLSMLGTKVVVRYQDAANVQLEQQDEDSTVENAWAQTLLYGTAAIPLVRTLVTDISQNVTANAINAKQQASTILSRVKRIRNTSQNITILRDYDVYDLVARQPVRGYDVRAGCYVWLDGFNSFSSKIGAGGSTDVQWENLFFITETEYNVITRTLVITPENNSSLSAELSR